MATDNFKEDYESLSTAMTDLGFSTSSSNFAKFSKRVKSTDIYVAVHIATQKALYQIGSTYDVSTGEWDNVVTDDIYQYQVWAEKNGNTFASISGAGKGSLDVDSIKAACSDVVDQAE